MPAQVSWAQAETIGLVSVFRPLSTQLLSSRIGCHIAGECVNHIAYADEIVLLAPSIKALQTLIDMCFKFAGDNDILYDETKTQCMAFWPRLYTQSGLPSVALV